ncbi:MAG: endonuclease domain-containing protein [Candidatus Margulisbacteria bacterium]|nr:endonuclease domain-containing protein [Candidatus Margulisiibacteriota bacterium]
MKHIKRDFARQLRQGQTPTEERVWELLRNNQLLGLKFRRQHVIEGFVADFYCHEQRLAIEIDGGIHEKKMNKDYDELRQREIEAEDIKVVRISNEEFEKNENILFDRIKLALETSYINTPSPLGRGGVKSLLVGGEGRTFP